MKFREKLNWILHPLLTVIFPSFCRLCQQPLLKPAEKQVCSGCLEKLEIHHGSCCPICGRFYYYPDKEAGWPCGDCLKEPPPFARHCSLGPYSGRLKEAVILFKYRGNEGLARPLAFVLYKELLRSNLLAGVELIVPVPLHRKREKARGFNQAELLARELGKFCGIPVETRALLKIKNTPAQVSLEAESRKLNLQEAFLAKKPERIADRVILLVDDVYTTGSTLKECSAVLLKAGAREVRAVTLARA